jgi:FAD/FMN-containing dehydrogenase
VFSGGTCPTVGAAGLTLGGGMGPNSRWAGLTCDLLTEATVVTADGEVVVANESSHPDLFWALRGSAGRNFGICSAFKYRLAPRPHRESTVYGLEFETRDSCAAAAKAILRGMRSAPASSSVLMIASTWPEGVGCVLWGAALRRRPAGGCAPQGAPVPRPGRIVRAHHAVVGRAVVAHGLARLAATVSRPLALRA